MIDRFTRECVWLEGAGEQRQGFPAPAFDALDRARPELFTRIWSDFQSRNPGSVALDTETILPTADEKRVGSIRAILCFRLDQDIGQVIYRTRIEA